MHNELLAGFVASHAEVRHERQAIVLAGPPGAGESTVVDSLIDETKKGPEHSLAINPDDFKDKLLQPIQDLLGVGVRGEDWIKHVFDDTVLHDQRQARVEPVMTWCGESRQGHCIGQGKGGVG